MEKTKFKPQQSAVPTIAEQKKARMIEHYSCKTCRWAIQTPTGGMPAVMLICHGSPPGMQLVATPQGASVQLVPRGIPDDHFCKEYERLAGMMD